MTNNRYAFGCGIPIMVSIPYGYSAKSVRVECGTTAYDGGVNQCARCSMRYPVSLPTEEEGDMEWYERNAGGE